jgi:hypothetical protein
MSRLGGKSICYDLHPHLFYRGKANLYVSRTEILPVEIIQIDSPHSQRKLARFKISHFADLKRIQTLWAIMSANRGWALIRRGRWLHRNQKLSPTRRGHPLVRRLSRPYNSGKNFRVL